MTPWSHGYVADSPYVASYQASQSPAAMAMTCAMMGVQADLAPDLVVADLGCGRGLTVNVLAAANPGWTVFGIDYHPAHVAEAAGMAADAGLDNAVFVDADLAEISDVEIDSFPEFDVVMLHGVWTWVSDAVRAGIVRLLARRLKPGGLCYVGYNVLPAFGRDFALQRLLAHAAARQQGDSAERARAAMQTVRALHATRPVHLSDTPVLRRIVAEGQDAPSAYVAHEFLTEHWRPVFAGDLARDLSAARLDLVGSVALHDNLTALQLEPGPHRIWSSLPPGPARDLVLDLCAGRTFRRDVFVRGRRPVDAEAALDAMPIAATAPITHHPPRLGLAAGVAEMPAALWEPIAQALTDGPCRIGELRARVRPALPTSAELAALLIGTGRAMPVLREGRPTPPTQRFNAALAAAMPVLDDGASNFALAAPALGAGLPCDGLTLRVAAEAAAGPGFDPAALAARLVRPGDAAAQEALRSRIADLWHDHAGVWRGLGIVA